MLFKFVCYRPNSQVSDSCCSWSATSAGIFILYSDSSDQICCRWDFFPAVQLLHL